MANKINAKLILELKASGLSRNQIAATRHMSKHSVSDVINIAKEKEITYENVKHLSEEEIYRMIFPDKFAMENLYEQPDYEYVHQELKRVGVTLKLLWQEYQDKCRLPVRFLWDTPNTVMVMLITLQRTSSQTILKTNPE